MRLPAEAKYVIKWVEWCHSGMQREAPFKEQCPARPISQVRPHLADGSAAALGEALLRKSQSNQKRRVQIDPGSEAAASFFASIHFHQCNMELANKELAYAIPSSAPAVPSSAAAIDEVDFCGTNLPTEFKHHWGPDGTVDEEEASTWTSVTRAFETSDVKNKRNSRHARLHYTLVYAQMCCGAVAD